MSWIMKANILSDNEQSVYGDIRGKLRYKSRKIRFKWEVLK